MKTNVNIFNALNESFNDEMNTIIENKNKEARNKRIKETRNKKLKESCTKKVVKEASQDDKDIETIANIAKLADIDKKDEKAYYLAGQLMNYYGSDMGTYFDEIQGNEEERFNEIYGMLSNKEENKETLNKILDELKNSEWIDKDDASAFGIDKDLAKTLEEYLNEGCESKEEVKECDTVVEEKINEDANEDEIMELVKNSIQDGKLPDEIEYKGKIYKQFNVMSGDTTGETSDIYYCNMENTPNGDPQESNDYFFVKVALDKTDNGYKGIKEIRFVEDLTESEQINEEETVMVNGNNEEQDVDYIITDVTVLNPVGDGDVQAPDIDALLTLVDESLKADYGDWGHIKVLSSRIDENSCFALVDISTKEIMKEFEDKGITDVAIGKNLIIESAGNLYDFKVNSLSGITKFSKKTNDTLSTIKEWVETEFLQEAKAEKEKAEELAKAAEQKEVTEQYINNRADLRQEIENIKMFIELSKQAKAAEEMKPSIQKRMYAFAAELPANIEVDDKQGLKFNSRDDIVEIIFGKEWVEETREDNEVVGVIKEGENLNESYSQFNIGEIEVVFNPDTYECLYSIPSADVQDKKINLTKVPSVDTPYDTDTIIKSFIETKFGVIPTEEEQKEVETTTEPEAPIEEPIDDTVDTGVEIEDEPVEEAELPEEPTEGEPEPTEEEIPQNETGTAQFYKIRPKNPITLEEIVTSDKEPEATSYIVIEEKLLNDDEWNDLVSDITKPQSYLENIQSIDRKNYAFNVIKLTNSNAGYSVLVDPLGYNYPRYLAVIE